MSIFSFDKETSLISDLLFRCRGNSLYNAKSRNKQNKTRNYSELAYKMDNISVILVSFQWKTSADHSKEVPATFRGEALKEVPAGEVLRACNFFRLFYL